jgi:hypothetical protein
MPSRRSTRSSCEGLSLIELLIALTIAMAVTAGGLALALSSFGLYEADHARMRLNQNLRAAQDFLATDIRQAGERLGNDFPAIEIIDGASGAPDEIVLRRALLSTVLRSCATVENTADEIPIAVEDDPPPGCVAVPDDNADGWPDNHGAWNAYRVANGVDLGGGETAVPAYIFDPMTGLGEFFHYAEDDQDLALIRPAAGHSWQHSYPVEHQCRLYLLEERRYRVVDGVLQVILNGDDPAPMQLVPQIEDLQTLALLRDGTTISATCGPGCGRST